MTEAKIQLKRQIADAFAGVTLGDGVGLWQGQGIDDYADEETLAAYRARDEKHDWSAIPVAELDRCYSSLSFFDAEGMRFHLPAFLIADIEGKLMTACPLFDLVHSTGPMKDRFGMLSERQREAVRVFLRLRLSDPSHEFDHPMIDAALQNYWAPRTAE